MESYLSFFLLLAAVALVAGVVFYLQKRGQYAAVQPFPMSAPPKEAFSSFTLEVPPHTPEVKKSPEEDTLLVLSVMAKPGARFASYELLQAISSAGLQFGEMNIFHYIYPEASYGIKLFSLVSAEEPGEFNLDHIGEFSCPGLMLFMDSARVPDPTAAFEIMLEKAEQLAEDLDGELRADPATPWTPEMQSHYLSKLESTRNHPVL